MIRGYVPVRILPRPFTNLNLFEHLSGARINANIKPREQRFNIVKNLALCCCQAPTPLSQYRNVRGYWPVDRCLVQSTPGGGRTKECSQVKSREPWDLEIK
ncbi:hypothetical protein BDV35DRAFT_386053 [Aspergillus flavus]|uniref:Uncharacterized protein n=2 Tax=Aspergillus subgen. Circumdati TaxID=2720871 RepID=A0A5N6GDX0_ASPFL|nr:hypothetical protein Ao3042_10139 [Aspergillus oryzae 3.042]KAB8240178.1 hypothetical protein BDV35DRAFT_386053 [Aspergillus flavus]KDE86009.1 hypothetical protein AO1008_00697 [Aspergillus oryzae 100-8]|eukprot:EIT73875.1 hypothetical protein Ao3042_10139 [Aspergillus oryzae 3.042]